MAGDVGVVLPALVDDHHARMHTRILDNLNIYKVAGTLHLHDIGFLQVDHLDVVWIHLHSYRWTMSNCNIGLS